MKYEIKGTTVPSVEMSLNQGDIVYTQKSGLFWKTDGINMKTNTKGGLIKGFLRTISGESLFLTSYTADKESKIAFSSTMPGSIIPINVSEKTMITQKGSFLAAENGVELKTTFSRKVSAGFFGGEGIILQKLTGKGMAFLEVAGDTTSLYLNAGESIQVNTGNLVAFEDGVDYSVEVVKGLGNILLAGEGLFLSKLTGPGVVYLQSMNLNEFAQRIVGSVSSNNNKTVPINTK